MSFRFGYEVPPVNTVRRPQIYYQGKKMDSKSHTSYDVSIVEWGGDSTVVPVPAV